MAQASPSGLAVGERPGAVGICWWRSLVALGAAVVLLLGPASGTEACDDPVYHYALHHWRRAAYYVYYFHRGDEHRQDAAVNRYLDDVSADRGGHANITLARIDVASLQANPSGTEPPLGFARGESPGAGSDPELAEGPQRLWARHRSAKLPFHMVLSPPKTELFIGRLDLATAQALVESPKRRELAELLCAGKHGVLLILLGRDEEQNAAARKAVQEVVTKASKQERDVGVVEVSCGDVRECWLARQLLQAERGLSAEAGARVFAVLGRGYVLGSCRGQGLTDGSIGALVESMHGPCSCEVRMAGLGTDLLTDWDWDAHLPEGPVYQEEFLSSALFDVEVDDEGARTGAWAALAPAGEARSEDRSSLTSTLGIRIAIVVCVAMIAVEMAMLIVIWRRKRTEQP